MNFKIMLHIMPWEIDQALMVADKLKKSSYHLGNEDKIFIDTVLNLSNSIIDWDKSKLPKQFFIDKYKIICNLLSDFYQINPIIYEGSETYGHLDFQKNSISEEIDYYIYICADIDFNETFLFYIIESVKHIKDEYFILTPQIFKSWDSSWDILVNNEFKDIPYSSCIDVDIHKINYISSQLPDPIIKPISQFKFAGWCDLYNKNFYEKLVPVLDEWKGYGPWDLYSMNVCNIAKQYGVNVQQYILENQIIWFSDTGCLRNFEEYGGEGQLKMLYKNFLSLKLGRQEQRSYIDKNLNQYLNQWFEYAKKNKIINV